ncbi:MAG: hypothetical protein ACREI8_14495 [Myxococcota bacterium]
MVVPADAAYTAQSDTQLRRPRDVEVGEGAEAEVDVHGEHVRKIEESVGKVEQHAGGDRTLDRGSLGEVRAQVGVIEQVFDVRSDGVAELAGAR